MQELSNKVISMQEMGEIIKMQLHSGGKVRFTPKGRSMMPMLRDNKDTVVLEKTKGKLNKYDLPLYQLADGSYILHRVVRVCEDGSYIMCGDNRIVLEYGIRDDNIVGVVTEFIRKGKSYQCTDYRYRLYCFVWVHIYGFRKGYRKTRSLLGRIKRKIKRKVIKVFK